MNRFVPVPRAQDTKPAQTGFTLIELMIALVLGLVVVGSAIAVFLSNRQAFITNTALSNVQDGSRIAFELLAHDIRQAGLTGCGSTGGVANVLSNGPDNGGTEWYANFDNAMHGYDDASTDPALTGLTTDKPVAGTNSIELIGADTLVGSVASDDEASATITLNAASTTLKDGDIVIVCEPDHAAITQVTQYDNASKSLIHDTGATTTPGNYLNNLAPPTNCNLSSTAPNQFCVNSTISELAAADWYIGTNAQKGTSLYRRTVINSGGVPTPTSQEMVRNVTTVGTMPAMTLTYHVANAKDFVNAGSITTAEWGQVDAVHVVLTLQSTSQRAGTDAKPITRQIATTIAVRNRVP